LGCREAEVGCWVLGVGCWVWGSWGGGVEGRDTPEVGSDKFAVE